MNLLHPRNKANMSGWGDDYLVPKFQSPPAAALNSERLALRQLSIAWLDEVEAMVNNAELNRLTATTKTFSRQVLQDWLLSRPSQTSRCDWAIIHQESGEFAGEVVLNELDEAKNSMNLRISLAEEKWLGQGFGTEALDLVLRYAFDELELNKVTLSVLTSNERAKASYAKLGFVPGREYSEGKFRFLRMSINKLQFIQAFSERQMSRLLAPEWKFQFDSAKRRAGICNYTDKTIGLSRHMASIHKIDQSQQTLWHEIAHALSGKVEGHGKKWLATAKSLGYRAEKFTGVEIAESRATWVGRCANDHVHYRYRRPQAAMSCGKCSRSFSKAALITWQQRDFAKAGGAYK